MAGTIIPPAFNETTNPTLISFLLQTIFQIAFKSGKSAKDLAVAFIRNNGAVFNGTLIIFVGQCFCQVYLFPNNSADLPVGLAHRSGYC
jgi:hypothetical protein